jgi:hypothetical protein
MNSLRGNTPGESRPGRYSRDNCLAVGAAGGVDATLGQAETLDWPASHKVLADNFVHIRGLDRAVPDSVGVDDDGWAMLALVEAASLVGANRGGEARGLQLIFENGVQRSDAVAGARRPGTPGFAAIGAYKNVAFKRWQRGLLGALSSS